MSPELDPITGSSPSTLSGAVLAERLAQERALREQATQYERELRSESRAGNHQINEEIAAAHADVHKAESEARDKAEAAIDKRLESMNEFRDQLRQQAATFLTIAVFETWKDEYRVRHEDLRSQITELQKTDLGSAASTAGRVRGQGMVIAAIIGSVAFAGTFISLIVIIANIVTKQP